MKLEHLMITLLIVSAIVSGIYFIVGDLEDEYNVPIDDEGIIAEYDQSSDMVLSLNQSITTLLDAKFTFSDVIAGMNAVWTTIKVVIKTPFIIINTFLTSTMSMIGLPEWFSVFITGIIVVLVLFSLLAIILRYKA